MVHPCALQSFTLAEAQLIRLGLAELHRDLIRSVVLNRNRVLGEAQVDTPQHHVLVDAIAVTVFLCSQHIEPRRSHGSLDHSGIRKGWTLRRQRVDQVVTQPYQHLRRHSKVARFVHHPTVHSPHQDPQAAHTFSRVTCSCSFMTVLHRKDGLIERGCRCPKPPEVADESQQRSHSPPGHLCG